MQESSVTCRAARIEDRDDIVEFQIAMALETEDVVLDRPTCTSGVEAAFRDVGKGRYFVAESDGRVVASLMITYEWSDWRNGHVWWIQSVFVRPELRQKRIYAALYDYVKRVVEDDPSIRGIRLYVDRRNERAQRVYARLGMNGEHYQVFEWMKE